MPCFNESQNLSPLYDKLCAATGSLGMECEFIFVDDGSSDGTLPELELLRGRDTRIVVIELSRNFGHQAALCAGLDHARGDAVIMMDADLQHPPEMIPQLVGKWRDGFDVVYTVRRDTEGASLSKRVTSRGFYVLINLLGNLRLPENSADFRLIDKAVARQLQGMKEHAKFIRGLVHWAGFRQCGIEYDAPKRHAGESKYSLIKMIRFAFDGILSFSSFPLHISTWLGFTVSGFSFLYTIYALYIKLFTNNALPGWTSVLVSVLFLGGVQLICLGVIGGYIDRIYTESKARPSYIVRNVLRESRGSHDC